MSPHVAAFPPSNRASALAVGYVALVAMSSVVICVDDEAPVLRSLVRLLRNEPYEFRATTDPAEALGWVWEGGARVVITDQGMPGVTGMDLLAELRDTAPETVRVLMTGYPGMEKQMEAAPGRAEHLVRKPWDERRLPEAIREWMLQRGIPEGGEGTR